jgi:hypothetical protein
MLVRLHRMTKERFKELLDSQRRLAMGEIKMKHADALRDHLTLVYAIQTEHPLLKERFKRKKIVIRPQAYAKVKQALDLILDQMPGELKFSPRVQHNALKLACAFTLPSYFGQADDKLEVTEQALNLALKFLVEEIAVRQQVEIDIDAVLFALGISEINRFLDRVQKARAGVASVERTEAPELFETNLGRDAQYLAMDLRARKRFRDCEATLSKEVGKPWETLEESTRQFLVTGDLLLALLQETSNGHVDFAPAVIEYSKAIEHELAEKLFGSFRKRVKMEALDESFYETSQLEASDTPSDLRFFRTTLKTIRAYLNESGPVTLGSIVHFMRQTTHQRYVSVPVIARFREFLQSSAELGGLIDAGFTNRLQEFTESYRNRAAHTGAISRSEAENCRQALLSDSGLLRKLTSV